MLAAGWRVLGVDAEPTTPDRVRRLLGDRDDLEVRVAGFAEVDLPPADLVHAGFALPFVGVTDFPTVWAQIRDTLRPRGWLAVDLFGDRDTWATSDGAVVGLSRAQVDACLDGLEIVALQEDEEDGDTFSGDRKHWHVFHVVARRPG